MNLKESILTLIDKATEPAVMNKENAVAYLDDLKDELSSRIEALHEEIDNDEALANEEIAADELEKEALATEEIMGDDEV